MIIREKLIIIGASGHGKVVGDIAKKMNQWKEIAYLDDDKSVKKTLSFDVVGTVDDAAKYKKADFFVGIGNNSIREKIQEKLKRDRFSIATLIHPHSVIAVDVEIGIGTVVMAGAVINSSTKIGNGCIVNTSSSIDHDNVIEDFVHVSPGVRTGGTVRLGKASWLGLGSVIISNIDIVENSIIGAGAVVIEDIIQSGTYIGIPANIR